MRPASMPPQWRKSAAGRMSAQPPASVRRRLKSKAAPQSNLLRRLLAPRRFSTWLLTTVRRFAMALTLDAQSSILAAMQSPVAKLTDELCGLVRVQTDHPGLLPPTPLPQYIGVGTRHTVQEQENAGLADKAVTWMLAPVFFCCVVAEKVKSPQTWEATEVFSRVVVSFMLKLFELATDLTGVQHKKQSTQQLEDCK